MTTVEVIIPVRNMAEHLPDCIGSLTSQLADGDRLTVIDDSSTDDSADVATSCGAHVMRLDDGGGDPYRARQLAANRSSADVLLFVDARCRARPGLVGAHKALLEQPGVVLSCTETLTRSGPHLAEKFAAKKQPFSLQGKFGVIGRLDFFPTANLGVNRDVFHAVEGFREMRSGADADLCWRIQKAELGRMDADRRILMEWVPRRKLRDLCEQWYRYGKSTAYLEQLYPDQSPSSTGKPVSVRERLFEGGRPAAIIPSVAFQLGVHRGRRESSS